MALLSTGQNDDGGAGDGDGGLGGDIDTEGGGDAISIIDDGGPESAQLVGMSAEQQVLALKGMLHESKAKLKETHKETAEFRALTHEVRGLRDM